MGMMLVCWGFEFGYDELLLRRMGIQSCLCFACGDCGVVERKSEVTIIGVLGHDLRKLHYITFHFIK